MIWRPYVQMKKTPEPWRIVDAEGVYLRTPERELIDSISSWWCMIHGYRHPEMVEAIREGREWRTWLDPEPGSDTCRHSAD